MKYLKIFVCTFLIVALLSFDVFAYTGGTYADVAQSNSTVQNLISFASNYKGFLNSDYVVFQDAQYSYYVFWGDLEYNGSTVTGSDVTYIRYYREGSGYDYFYTYTGGSEDALTLAVNNLVVTNMEELGSASALYRQYLDYHYSKYFYIFVGACCFALLCLAFRRTFK